MRVTTTTWIAISSLAGLGSGCGGEEATTPVYGAGEDEPLSKAAFIREADEICSYSQAKIEASADELANAKEGPSDPEVRRVALGVVVPGLEAQVDAIRALGPPAEGADEIEAILAATEAGIAAIEAEPEALIDGPPEEIARAARLSKRFGAKVCGDLQ